MRKILGLDVSTHSIGITIAEVDDQYNVNLLLVTHLRPRVSSKIKGSESLFEKARIFNEEIEKYRDYGITDVVVEEPLINSNNANTAATLLKFNGMVSMCVFNMLGITPMYISSYDARKYSCPELMAVRVYNKKGETYDVKKIITACKKSEVVPFGAYPFDCAKKLILWNIVSERFPYIEWVYDKDGDLKKENFDASDSLICVLGMIGMERYGGCEPKVTEYRSFENDETKKTVVEYTVSFCGSEFRKKISLD